MKEYENALRKIDEEMEKSMNKSKYTPSNATMKNFGQRSLRLKKR